MLHIQPHLPYGRVKLFHCRHQRVEIGVVFARKLVEEADGCQTVGLADRRLIAGVLGVPVEELELRRVLHTLQVVLGALQGGGAPVPHRALELVPAIGL